MIDDMQTLLDGYWAWLRENTKLNQIKDWIKITTPYLDRHNDCLEIYAKRKNGGFVLTDDGYIIQDLEMNGCKIDTPKRKDLLKLTLSGFGIQRESNELMVQVTSDNFALQKHNLLQAMLAVNDLFYLSSPISESLFYEDVTNWLNLSNIRYTPNFKLTGKSGYDHKFDFVIPKSSAKSERILRTINNPSRDAAETMIFAWLDTKDVRSPDTRAYAILNDANGSPDNALQAMKNHDVFPILWSKREDVKPELVA